MSKNKDLINIDTAMQELSCFTLDLSIAVDKDAFSMPLLTTIFIWLFL